MPAEPPPSGLPPPLVSIVALCYNHARFVREALDSVVAQTYPHWELIVVDDASTDASAATIAGWVAANPGRAAHVRYLTGAESRGACAAFNHGLARCRGEFVVDLATDDVLLPTRLAEQVAAFGALDASYGVVYTDAELITEDGRFVRHHYTRTPAGQLTPAPASGAVFADVLGRYFISTPTMLIRRQVLTELGGYDERLAYEDFDFWVRSARRWRYHFLDRVLTRKRLHPQAHSRQFYRPGDPQLASTIRVCAHAATLCRAAPEWAALRQRLRYELRQAVRYRLWPEAYALASQLRALPNAALAERLLARLIAVVSGRIPPRAD